MAALHGRALTILRPATVALATACAASAHAEHTPLTACEGLELAAAGKAALHLFSCHSKAVAVGRGVDSGCLTKTTDRLAATFALAEVRTSVSSRATHKRSARR